MDGPAMPAQRGPQTLRPPLYGRPQNTPPAPPRIQASCPHLSFHTGRRSFGPNIPDFAQGDYFPGDRPGPRCDITGEACVGVDSYACPQWKQSSAVCPDCLEFLRRRWPTSLFREARLLMNAIDGRYRCPACEAEYASLEAVLESATNRLRDLLDDLDCTEGQLAELRQARDWSEDI